MQALPLFSTTSIFTLRDMNDFTAPNAPAGSKVDAEQTAMQTSTSVSSGAAVEEEAKASGLGALVVDLAMMGLVSAAVSLAAWLYLPKLFGPAVDTPRIEDVVVTVNFEAIAREQIMALSDLVRSGEIEPSEMPKRSKAFTEGLLTKIREQADQGKIVLRSENVLAAPDAVLDLTDRFRKELQKEGLMARNEDKSESNEERSQDSK